MICQGFPSEMYDLFALGVLDEAEADGIRDHVRMDCEVCHDSMRASLTRVTELGLAVVSVEPPKRLRKRVVASVTPVREGWFDWLRSPALGAAAAVVAVGVGAAWMLSVYSRPSNLIAQFGAPPVPSISIPAAPGAPAVSPAPAVSDGQLEAANRALQAVQAEALRTSTDLTQQRAVASKLENELRDKDQQLVAARHNLDTAQARYTLAAKDLESAESLRKELVAYQTRVGELTTQVEFYKASLDRQKRGLDQNMQLVALLSAPSSRIVDLKATEAGGGSSARALVGQNGKAVFFAAQLPALASGRSYQLWLMRKQAPAVVSGGVFRPGSDQGAMLEIADARSLAGLTGLAVTEEPLGGSPLPTGHKILVGLPRS